MENINPCPQTSWAHEARRKCTLVCANVLLNDFYYLFISEEAKDRGMIAEGKPLKVNIEFSLQSPQGGIHFVVPKTDSEQAPKKQGIDRDLIEKIAKISRYS